MSSTTMRVLILLAISSVCSEVIAQSFTGLGDLSGGVFRSNARGISADGKYVVGESAVSGAFSQAFLWSEDHGLTSLGALPNQFTSFATAVSTDGTSVVGHSDSDASPLLHAVHWTIPGGISPITGFTPTTRGSFAEDMTPDGQVIVGRYRDDSGNRAYRWTAATGAVEIDDILGGGTDSHAYGVSADGSVVVGYLNEDRAFRWTEVGGTQSLGDLPGGNFFSRAFAVSADGNVIVGEATSAAGREAFRWTAADGMVGLGSLASNGFESWASDATVDGRLIVGTSLMQKNIGAPDDYAAFIWDKAHGMRSLQDWLISEHGFGRRLNGWKLESANAISDDGLVIVGNGTNPNGNPEAWRVVLPAYVVPEPVTALLGAFACLGFIVQRTRHMA